MTLEKAIGIIQQLLDGTQPTSITDRRDAIKLGREALKHIDLARRSRDVRIIDSLPGETES